MVNYPTNNVCYRIQNVNYGTYLDIVDVDYTSGARKNKATLALRPIKEGTNTQKWVFKESPDDTSLWSIVNYDKPLYVDGSKLDPDPTKAAIYHTRYRATDADWPVVAGTYLSIQQIRSGDVVYIATADGTKSLHATDSFTIKTGVEDKESYEWRLIEICPILSQVSQNYRLRSLNGRILNLTPSSVFNAMVLSEANANSANRCLFEIEPAPKGKCTIKVLGGTNNDYLIPASEFRGNDGRPYWVTKLNQGPKSWDISSIGGFAYQFTYQDGNDCFALTVENDTDIILKVNKVGHGQIWLVERKNS